MSGFTLRAVTALSLAIAVDRSRTERDGATGRRWRGGVPGPDGLAVPTRSGTQSMPRSARSNHRVGRRIHEGLVNRGCEEDAGRLLLRVPDGQRTADAERRSRDRSAGDRRRDRAGVALLRGVQGVRADVSPGDARRSRHDVIAGAGAASDDRLRGPAPCLARLPGAVQPRPGIRAHRPFARRGAAHQAHPGRDRPRPGSSVAAWSRHSSSARTSWCSPAAAPAGASSTYRRPRSATRPGA